MDLNEILQVAVKARASDIHLKAGLPPIFRRDSQLVPYREAGRLTPDILAKLAADIMTGSQRDVFERNREIDMGYGVQGLGRFIPDMPGDLDDAVDLFPGHAVLPQLVHLAQPLFRMVGGDVGGQGRQGDDGRVQGSGFAHNTFLKALKVTPTSTKATAR